MHSTGPNPREHEPGWRWGHPACLAIEDLLKACTVGTARASGGPGGQHRNKVETQVFVRHTPTGLEAHADERRSQSENMQVRVAVPLGEIGSGLWKSRVRSGRIGCSPDHDDYPAMLAEALDVIAACRWEAPKAGLRLGCSASQLIKLVKDHPPAMHLWNEHRRERGEHDLK
jgi:hypothetical protein